MKDSPAIWDLYIASVQISSGVASQQSRGVGKYLILGIKAKNLDFFRGGDSFSETQFGLTPLPSLRSETHKVIRKILPYIRALSLHLNWAMPNSLPASIV